VVSRSAPLLALVLLLVFTQAAHSSSTGLRALEASRGDAAGAISAAEASGGRAFLLIRGADREGGNVTSLALRFNEALELVYGARVLLDEGMLDEAVKSAENARDLFEALGGEADLLATQAVADASTRRAMVLLAAPVVSILVTVFSYMLIRLWQRGRLERTMEMEIKEAEAS